MEKLKKYCLNAIQSQHFDHLAVSVIDFQSQSFESFEVKKYYHETFSSMTLFDLASVTKPLVLASTFLKHPDKLSGDLKLLLNHQSGLPAWAILSSDSWKKQIENYKISKSETVYSDLGAIRLGLEIEKLFSKNCYDVANYFWDKEVVHWMDIANIYDCPETGFRDKKIIQGTVHDPNAFTIKSKIAHAGLFATIDGLSRTILNLSKAVDLFGLVNSEYKNNTDLERYILGFDRVENLDLTTAGKGCSKHTFGHLGFVGTSFWIDIEQKKCVAILSNGTQNYWYEKQGINTIRRNIGEMVWKM